MEFLAWPGVVLALGLVVVFVFKRSIERLIDRTQKVSRSGLEAGGAVQQASEQESAARAAELLKEFDNALLLRREAEIHRLLEAAGLPSGAERERVLLRYLAGSILVASFEKAYYNIWGSQISVLQFLNSAGSGGVELDVLRPWFEQAAANDPQRYAGDTIDRWLGFLESFSLVTRASGRVAITLEGREFLKYAIHQGYTLYKVG